MANDGPDQDLKEDAEASGREVVSGTAATSRLSSSSDRHLDPVDDLKNRLSMWGESRNYKPDEDDEEGSEHELLLDPNMPEEYNIRLDDLDIHRATSNSFDDEDAAKRTDEHDTEDSPYPEVRAAVKNYDEDLPCNTVRAWVIGLTLVTAGASMNTIFSLRQPSISVGPLVAQIVAWPMGHGWAKVMPSKEFATFGIRWSLNPGPFNVKEHAIIVVMASVSFSVAYATDIVLAQLVFYKQNFGMIFQLLLTISSQSLGYGIAGIMRKFLGESPRSGREILQSSMLTSRFSVPCRHDMARQPCGSDVDECHV